MKKAPKTEAKSISFSDEKTILFSTLSFMLILCEKGRWSYNSPDHFGSLLAPFWLPLAHFWLPLAHFWLPLAPFWLTFGIPWLTFGALCFTFAHPGIHFLTFAISCPHFSYFFGILCKISVLINFHCKSHSRSIKSYFPEAHRTHPNRKYIFSGNPPFKGLERNIYRRQLRSAPGPEAPEACLTRKAGSLPRISPF